MLWKVMLTRVRSCVTDFRFGGTPSSTTCDSDRKLQTFVSWQRVSGEAQGHAAVVCTRGGAYISVIPFSVGTSPQCSHGTLFKNGANLDCLYAAYLQLFLDFCRGAECEWSSPCRNCRVAVAVSGNGH